MTTPKYPWIEVKSITGLSYPLRPAMSTFQWHKRMIAEICAWNPGRTDLITCRGRECARLFVRPVAGPRVPLSEPLVLQNCFVPLWCGRARCYGLDGRAQRVTLRSNPRA